MEEWLAAFTIYVLPKTLDVDLHEKKSLFILHIQIGYISNTWMWDIIKTTE